MKCCQSHKKVSGFTLIEVIIVIAILGILAAIAVPRYNGFQEQARQQADQSSAETIARVGLAYLSEDISRNSVSMTDISDKIDAGITPQFDTDTNKTFYIEYNTVINQVEVYYGDASGAKIGLTPLVSR